MQEVARRYQMSVEKVHAVLEAARAAPAPTVAAREIFGDIPAALQSKAYEKGGFPPELLNDADAVRSARRIVSARN